MPPCCGGKKSNARYEVSFNNGTPNQTYDSVAEAQAALAAAGRPPGSSFKAVER